MAQDTALEKPSATQTPDTASKSTLTAQTAKARASPTASQTGKAKAAPTARASRSSGKTPRQQRRQAFSGQKILKLTPELKGSEAQFPTLLRGDKGIVLLVHNRLHRL